MSRTRAQIDTDRQERILTGKPLLPHGECNFCGYRIPPRALWCGYSCSQEFEQEKKELLGGKDKP